MIPEQVKVRRGEPVILTYEDGKDRLGTIEWGDGIKYEFSIYCEVGGREILRLGAEWPKLRSDPGGKRPVWGI
jgi:hypothetical protein